MSTSLAAQLQKLAVPQTTLLQRDKKRASLLFDPKVAAGIDRDTFYDIGISGLRELQKYNEDFVVFESTLFSASSRNIERAVESKIANAKLNKNIRRFLMLLTPYFLLKPAHSALEWLINRFSIHEYNKDDFLMLILPYHETNVFSRCLQLFHLHSTSDRWHWLRPLQKPGIHLPKATLYNHCASDVGFLQFLAAMVHTAVKENGPKATALTTLFTFYCTTTIGALEHCKELSEPQITAILPPLLRGLGADVPDYTASAYMIAAQVLKKTRLSEKVLDTLVAKVSSDHQKHLRMEAALLLLLVYQSQREHYTAVPAKGLRNLVHSDWFAVNLGKLAASGSYVLPLFVPVLRGALKSMRSDPCRRFVECLLSEVRLTDAGAEILIKIVLDRCPLKDDDDDPQVDSASDSEDSEPRSKVPVNEWYAELIKRLETVYPDAFDKVVRTVMSGGAAQKHRRALRSVMHFVMSSVRASGKRDQIVFEKLYHHNAQLRARAVQLLVKNFDRLPAKDKELLEGAVGERMLDEDPAVAVELLQLDENRLIDVLGEERFIEHAIKLLVRCIDDQPWLPVAKTLTEILCDARCNQDLRLFLPLLPFVFPSNAEELKIAHRILLSRFARGHAFLHATKKKMKPVMSPSQFCQLVYQCLAKEGIGERADFRAMPGKAVIHDYLTALFVSAGMPAQCPVKDGLAALRTITPHLSSARVVATSSSEFSIRTCIEPAREGTMPLQGLLQCLEAIIDSVDCRQAQDTWLDFTAGTDSVTFLVTVLASLVQGCASSDNAYSKLCSSLLKKFFTKFFPSLRNRLNFLANFTVIDDFAGVKLNARTQLRIISILNALLCQTGDLPWTLEFSGNLLVPAALIGLTHSLQEIRQTSMDILMKITESAAVTHGADTYLPLLQELFSHKEEILLDTEQLALILYTVAADNNQLNYVLNHLFSIATDAEVPVHVSAMLLRILTFVNSPEIFESTAKLACALLTAANNSNTVLDVYRSSAIHNIVLRFNETTVAHVHLDASGWQLLALGLKQDVISVEYEQGKLACPAVLMLEQITRPCFANAVFPVQEALFKLLVGIATEAENPEVVSAVNRVIKKIDLDATLLLDNLIAMRDAKSDKVHANPKRQLRRASQVPTADILVKGEWKQGVTVLEFIQDKKKLTNVQLLLPLMFGILKKCLDFDDQSSVEYPKQLLLSGVLHCCNRLQADGEPLPANAFDMELVVQCIRASQNPQTHHHALLVLAHTASLLPDQVLHNIMAIFTFMGSSVLRHDDAYSFQIIAKIIETVVPILVQAKDSNRPANVAAVLRVFVDVMLDVPEHRRMPLFNKLLTTLGVDEHLWLFLLLVFEAHVTHGPEPKPKETKSRLLADAEPVPKRLDVATNIVLEFAPDVCMGTSIKLLEYLKRLPVDRDKSPMTGGDTVTFNVQQHSAKQFRHYKYTLVTFLSGLLTAKPLVNAIATLAPDATLAMETLYKSMIVHILTYIQEASKTVDRMASTPQAQYWKVLVHHCYDILDSTNALLTSDMFLLVVRGLVAHNIPTVRRKAMELLNTKLQYQPAFFGATRDEPEVSESAGLFALMPSLVGIIRTVTHEDTEPEHELTQQTALLSLKLLIKLLAASHPDKFTPVLDYVTDLLKSDRVHGNILASVVLCLAELCAKLRAHAIPALVKFMPALIRVLKRQKLQDSPGLLLMCVVTATQKIVESLPLFLSPYLEKLLCELTVLSAKWSDEEDAKLAPFVKKLTGIRSNIGSVIPSRVLIPVVGQTYTTLLTRQQYTAIGPLMHVLAGNLATLHGSELTALLPDLTAFFLAALQFRTDTGANGPQADVNLVEDHVIKALTVLVLKLSETTFRPFYYRLFDWAVRGDSKSEKVITFYRLSHGIAGSLKGLFVLFAGHFVKNASALLDACNAIKNDGPYFADPTKDILLTESILSTLRAVFLYDSHSFVDKDRFGALMQPMVDQLENTVGGVDSLAERAARLVVPCIAQFAVASADDALWKQLNYQVLLKTRHNVPAVRLIGLNCLLEVAKKVGEDFLPLLPETIPFLAELLEDEDEQVEATCQKVVQDLEKVLGEPLQKYF